MGYYKSHVQSMETYAIKTFEDMQKGKFSLIHVYVRKPFTTFIPLGDKRESQQNSYKHNIIIIHEKMQLSYKSKLETS